MRSLTQLHPQRTFCKQGPILQFQVDMNYTGTLFNPLHSVKLSFLQRSPSSWPSLYHVPDLCWSGGSWIKAPPKPHALSSEGEEMFSYQNNRRCAEEKSMTGSWTRQEKVSGEVICQGLWNHDALQVNGL